MKTLYFRFYAIGLLLLCFFACSRQTNPAEVLMDNAENIIEQHPDSALKMLDSILFPEDLSKNRFNKYSLLLVRAKDKCYKDITGDTIIFAVKDYFVHRKDDRNAAYSVFYCARVLHEQRKVEDALKAYQTAIEWANTIQDNNLTGLANSNLGILNREHYLHAEAIIFQKKAVEMYRKAGNHKNEIATLSQIADCFLLENKTDSAFYYYDKSIKKADQYQLTNLQSNLRQAKGVAYREKKDYELAKQFLNEALAYVPDSIEHTRILINIAKVYLAENKTDSAKYYLNQALTMNMHDPMLLMNYHLSLSQIEERESHYKEALGDYKEFHDYTFKVFNVDKNNKLMELQQKYDFEKLKNEKKSVIIKQKNGLLALSLVLLALVVIGIIFYRKTVQNKRLLQEAEYRIMSLQKMAKEMTAEHLEEKQSLRSLILQYADILKKSALIEKDIPEAKRKDGEYMLNKFNKIK